MKSKMTKEDYLKTFGGILGKPVEAPLDIPVKNKEDSEDDPDNYYRNIKIDFILGICMLFVLIGNLVSSCIFNSLAGVIVLCLLTLVVTILMKGYIEDGVI